MSAASNVLPLRPRAATRFGPQESRRLAQLVIPRKSMAQDFIAYLLRRCDPKSGYVLRTKRAWLMEEFQITRETVRAVFRRIEDLGLATVHSGVGHTNTRIILDADRLRSVSIEHGLRNPLTNHPVHPGEPASSPRESPNGQGAENLPSEGRKPALGGQKTSPPNVRARETSGTSGKAPQPPSELGGAPDACPHHGAGCASRRCGRSPRQLEAGQRQRQAEEQRAADAAEWDARTRAAAQAAISPPTDLVNSARAAIHASKGNTPTPTKGTPDEN